MGVSASKTTVNSSSGVASVADEEGTRASSLAGKGGSRDRLHDAASTIYRNDATPAPATTEHSPSPVVYLNNAGQARLSKAVQQAGVDAIQRLGEKGGSLNLADQLAVRTLFAQIVGLSCRPLDVAFWPSTAFGMTLAASNIKGILVKGSSVLVLQDQMNSEIYALQTVCCETEAHLLIIPYPTGEQTWTDLIIEALRDSTNNIKLACLPPLHWSDGSLIDLCRIGPLCKDLQIPLIVDATQGLGILPSAAYIDKIHPSILVASTHKWLRGPSGTALAYIDPSLDWQPLDQHGRSRLINATNPLWESQPSIMTSNGYPSAFYPDSRRLDGGGKPHDIMLPMLKAALQEVVKIDTLGATAIICTQQSAYLETDARASCVPHGWTTAGGIQ
jgi:selenocysteine lyase/cysteine desulfurase